MATANIIRAWQDGVNAYIAVWVAEGGSLGNVEYHAQTPLTDAQGNTLTVAQVKANLATALTAVRNAQLASTSSIPTITGTVTI
jgi:hypothetical protein